jgi:hypothetical protein
MRQFRRRVADTVRWDTQYHASITGDVDDYCDRMLRPGEWGGETEIAAMATLLQVDVVVCRAGEPPRRYQANPDRPAPNARVLHIAHVSASGQDTKASARNHYVYFARARDCYWQEPQSSSRNTSAKSSGQPASLGSPDLPPGGTAPASPEVAPTPQAATQAGALELEGSKHGAAPSVTPTTPGVPADSAPALAELQASSGLPASTLTNPIFLALDHGRLWALYEVVTSWTDRYHSASTPLWALCLVAGAL